MIGSKKRTPCPHCKGTGEVKTKTRAGVKVVRSCPHCGGSKTAGPRVKG